MYVLQKLDYYLNGVVFTIKTDHKPLQYLLEQKDSVKNKNMGIRLRIVHKFKEV